MPLSSTNSFSKSSTTVVNTTHGNSTPANLTLPPGTPKETFDDPSLSRLPSFERYKAIMDAYNRTITRSQK